jgi:hypothetical protein
VKLDRSESLGLAFINQLPLLAPAKLGSMLVFRYHYALDPVGGVLR